jgi:hypothetical protein
MHKSAWLKIRVTKNQLDAISARAKEIGISRSDYVRATSLLPAKTLHDAGSTISPDSGSDTSPSASLSISLEESQDACTLIILSPDVLRQLFNQLRHIGINLNQATKALNTIVAANYLATDVLASEFKEAKTSLRQWLKTYKDMEDTLLRLERNALVYISPEADARTNRQDRPQKEESGSGNS